MKRYQCGKENCNLVFNRPSKLLRHELLHTGIKSYQCPVEGCVKSYSTPSHLNRHLKSHRTNEANENPAYRCSYPACQALFVTKWGLQRHEKSHVNVNYCECCGIHFKLASKYLKHMDQHAITRSQKCTKCGKSFERSTRQKYLRHESRCGLPTVRAIRCSADTFACDRCGTHFDRRHGIRRHVVDCYSLQCSMFACGHSDCTKVFFYKRNLRSHIYRRHMDIRYVCPEEGCCVKLLHKKSHRRHMQRHHVPSAAAPAAPNC